MEGVAKVVRPSGDDSEEHRLIIPEPHVGKKVLGTLRLTAMGKFT